MVSSQTTQLWTFAKDANEYERMHNLFSGKLKSVLNDEKISSALREKMAISLAACRRDKPIDDKISLAGTKKSLISAK
jgi:hypothetical protein